MNKSSATCLALSRVVLGWLMFYAGITKILDPKWSAAGYLQNAKTLPEFYSWLASPSVLPVVNFINEWGLTLLGISLILGIGVRLSASLGVILMLLYYLPASNFPFVEHGFLVDEHIIYASIFAFFASIRAGRYYGLEKWCSNLPLCSRNPKLRNLIG